MFYLRCALAGAFLALVTHFSAYGQGAGLTPCGGGKSLSATSVTSNVQLSSCGGSAVVWNTGSVEVFINIGTASNTAATTSSYSIPPGSALTISTGNAPIYVAAITTAGVATVRIVQGQGNTSISSGLSVVGSSDSATAATTSASSTTASSNLVLKASAGNLYALTTTIGATSGYLLLFDATALPSNGAVTPVFCYPVTSNGTNGAVAMEFYPPKRFAVGITAGFSTTGCFTLTASATASFFGGYQ